MPSITGQKSEFQSLRDSNPLCNWGNRFMVREDRAYQTARQGMAGYYLEKAFGSLVLFEERVYEEQIVESAMRLLA